MKVIPYVALAHSIPRILRFHSLCSRSARLTMAGAYIVRKLKPEVFYPLAYGLGLLAAFKLLYDSLPL